MSPDQQLVVPVVEKVGEYGGVWRRAFLGPTDANNYVRVVYDVLFRFSPDGRRSSPISIGQAPRGWQLGADRTSKIQLSLTDRRNGRGAGGPCSTW